MADIMMLVDTAVITPVNRLPLIDDTDFKTIEAAVAYNAAGMDLRWNFVTAAGVQTSTAVTPTTAGSYDWTHLGDGIYSMEIPASGGVSANNDTEGFGWWSGVCTGVLPWAGPIIQFSPANVVNSLVTGSDVLDVSTIQFNGSAVTQTGGRPEVNTTHAAGTAWGSGAITAASIAADAITAAKIADGAIDAATFAAGAITATVIADGAIDAGSIAAAALNGKGDWNVGKTGYTLTATTGLGNQTADITGSISGSVGSVTGAVGSVTGAVGSVTGNVGGNVVGTVAGVTPSTAAQVAAILTTQITEAYRANGAAPTLAQFMSEVLGHLGESSISGTTKTVKRFDHSTSAETFTLDDATNPSSITRAS